MSKGSSPPPPPDPYKVADAQSEQNKEAAAFNAAVNRGNVYTPFGSQEYQFRGTDPTTGAPMWDQTITLDPTQQAIFDQQTQQQLRRGTAAGEMLDGVVGQYGTPMDVSGVPGRMFDLSSGPIQGQYDVTQAQTGIDTGGLPELETDAAGLRDRAEQAIYDRGTRYLDRRMGRTRERERARLANQGIVEGSEAYNNAMRDLDEREDTLYGQARQDAIIGGGQEASRLFDISSGARGQQFGERLAGGQFQQAGAGINTAQAGQAAMFANNAQAQRFGQDATAADFRNRGREQQLNEMFALRGQPMNEYNAMMGGYQLNTPNFSSAPNVATNPADLQGQINANYGQQIDRYNSRNQMLAAILGAGAGVGSAFLGRP